MPVRSICCTMLLVLASCAAPFRPQSIASPAELYQAALRERAAGREDNAIAAFERLQIVLAPSDTLLASVYFALGELHAEKEEWLLAGQAYLKVPENFPDDSIADEAMLAAGHAHAALWRRPDLDAQYGYEALGIYNLLIRAYPSSPHLGAAGEGAAKMREWLGRKDVLTGMHYFRRRAYDSAIIYFNDAARNYPGTDAARDALIQIIRTYRELQRFHRVDYAEEITATCAELKRDFAGDPLVTAECPTGTVAADSTR